MREILFRGKRVDNDKWVEGIPYNECIICGDKIACEIIPETVGQYTGLTDKNGKKIFEGDILESRYDEKLPEDCAIEEVIWKYNGWCKREYVSGAGTTDVMDEDGILKYSEVIGNIHDNPELLGGIQ